MPNKTQNKPTPKAKTLEQRLSDLEGRQDKDEQGKRLDRWHKWYTALVSTVALIVAGVIGIASLPNTSISRRALELKEKESIPLIRIADVVAIKRPITHPLDRALDGDKMSPRLSFRIVNDGAPITIDEINVECKMSGDPLDGLSQDELDIIRNELEELNDTLPVEVKEALMINPSAPTQTDLLRLATAKQQPRTLPKPLKLMMNEGYPIDWSMPPNWHSATITVHTSGGRRFDFPVPETETTFPPKGDGELRQFKYPLRETAASSSPEGDGRQ